MLDQGFSALAASNPEQALRAAIPVLKHQVTSPGAVLAIALALRALNRHPDAERAARVALDLATASAPPLAVASLCLLQELGTEVSPLLRSFSQRYGKGSPLLDPTPARPPAIARREADLLPLASTLSGSSLLTLAADMIGTAGTAAEPVSDSTRVHAHPVFSALSAGTLEALIRRFRIETRAADETVLRQGSLAQDATLVARGQLEARRRGRDETTHRLARLGAGALIGDVAIVARAPVSASIVTCSPCVLLPISKTDLNNVALENPHHGSEFAAYCNQRMLQNVVRTSPLFRTVGSEQREELLRCCELKSYESGEKLLVQGDATHGLHVIVSGQVAVVHEEGRDLTTVEHLTVGDSVGEVGLILRRKVNAHVIADCPTITLFLRGGGAGAGSGLMSLVTSHPKLLAQLYQLAVERDQQMERLVHTEATDLDDFVLV